MTNEVFKSLAKSLIVVLSAASSCFGAMNYVTAQGEGAGMDYKSALETALSDAVGRVNGIAIATKSHHAISELATYMGEKSSVTTSQVSAEEVDTATAGFVRKFNVTAKSTDPKGITHVSVEVEVARYEAKENKRQRLAISKFSFDGTGSVALAGGAGTGNIENQTTRELINVLTSSRKFAILDSEFSAAREVELKRLQSGKVSGDERARLNQEIGADYVLSGRIEEFSIEENNAFGMQSTARFMMGRARVHYTVVDLASGATLLSHTAELQRQFVANNNAGINQQTTELAKGVCKKIAGQVLETIYPVKVINVSDEDVVTLNSGSDTLTVGQVLDVFNLGKRLNDAYTGEYLGYEEIPAGTIEVTRVLPMVSYAAIKKNAGKFTVGATCRPQEKAKSTETTNKQKKELKNEIDDLFK